MKLFCKTWIFSSLFSEEYVIQLRNKDQNSRKMDHSILVLKIADSPAMPILKYLPISAWCFHYAQKPPFSGLLLKCLC